MRTTRFGSIAVVFVLLCVPTAKAGPAYQALKACLRNCIATTAPWTVARALCGADCLADYADSKIALNAGPNLGIAVASTGFSMIQGIPYLNLIGDLSATVSVDILHGPAPLQVDYILVSDLHNPADPAFGMLLGSSNNAGNGFAFAFAPVADGYVVAQARYTSSPAEDIDQATEIYITTQQFVPEPSSLLCGIGGIGAAACFGIRRRRAMPAK